MNIDEIRYEDNIHLQTELIEKLNKTPIKANNKKYKIKWGTESAERLKVSKGVFAPISKENSFIMGTLITNNDGASSIAIKEEVGGLFKSNALRFSDINFYIHSAGVAQLSAKVEITRDEEISILQLESISEDLNQLYKEYFEELCFQVAIQYYNAIKDLEFPIFGMYQIPDVREFSDEEKSRYILPWTHRIYHIHDKKLFELDNPGEFFRFLLTPSKKMDIDDYSIYENRWIYFGWGHSIIFTKDMEDGYYQTQMEAYDYVRVVEIAQVNWRSLELLDDLVDINITWFNLFIEELDLKNIKENIYDIRDFHLTVQRILDNFRDVKITFDTEKRNLLSELNDRWLTEKMYDVLDGKLKLLEDTLEDLYMRQKEKKDDSLNTIALAFTIISLVDVFSAIFDIFSTDYRLDTILQITVLITGVIALGLLIIFYLKLAERR